MLENHLCHTCLILAHFVIILYPLQNPRQAKILIIRHPADAILAHWKWTINYEHNETLTHTNNPPAQYFGMIIILSIHNNYITITLHLDLLQNVGKNTFVAKQIKNWRRMIQNEVLHSKKKHLVVVRYEDIKKNVSNEV